MKVPEIETDCAREPDVLAFKTQQTNRCFLSSKITLMRVLIKIITVQNLKVSPGLYSYTFGHTMISSISITQYSFQNS